MNPVLLGQNINMLYKTFAIKKKERFDIILEPLQAIIQLALLRFCPLGTKITIHDNLLELQTPTYVQGIIRWYNNDNKEDLFYLFNVCKRFSVFYNYLKNYKEDLILENGDKVELNLYNILVESANIGLDKLSQTYNTSDKVSLLHTLQLYKMLLINPGVFNKNNIINKGNSLEYESYSRPISSCGATTIMNANINDIDTGLNMALGEKEGNSILMENVSNESVSINGDINESTNVRQNIDDIFINIKQIYSKEEIKIIQNIFIILIKNEENDCSCYINGLNKILLNTNSKIRKWISDNIIF